MNKIQKIIKSEYGFIIILLISIIGLFIILSPKISSIVFLQKRQATLNNFINTVKAEKTLGPQKFWEFREFYSPGSFDFSKNGITSSLSKDSATEIGINYNQSMVDLTYSFFSSTRLKSLDMLTKQSSLTKLINREQFKKDKIIFMNNNCLIYQENAKTVKIVFLLGSSDLQKANGFFDFKDKDKKITEGENWFDVTSINVD